MRLGTLTPSFRLGSATPSRIYLGTNQVFLNPLSLSPALWLSDTGSDLSVWPDLSGNGRNATQATPANRPEIVSAALNGRQVRRFDGVNDSLAGTLSNVSSLSVFAVFVPTLDATSTALYARVFSQRGSATLADFAQTGHYIPIIRDSQLSAFGSWASSGVRATQSAVDVTKEIRSSIHTGSLISNFRNGSASSTYSHTLGNNGAAYFVGGQSPSTTEITSGFLKGDIAEILVFPTALSTADRQAVETYLNAKWAIY